MNRKLSAQLNQAGILTAHDLAQADPVTIQRRWSILLAKTVRELNGTPCLTLDDIPPDKQQIACTRSFGRPVTAGNLRTSEMKQERKTPGYTTQWGGVVAN